MYENGTEWERGNVRMRCLIRHFGEGSTVETLGSLLSPLPPSDRTWALWVRCVDDSGGELGDGDEFRSQDGLHVKLCVRDAGSIPTPPYGRHPRMLDPGKWRVVPVACIDASRRARPCTKDFRCLHLPAYEGRQSGVAVPTQAVARPSPAASASTARRPGGGRKGDRPAFL